MDKVNHIVFRAFIETSLIVHFSLSSLIYRQVGRIKEVKDGAVEKGMTYYQSLLKSRNAVSLSTPTFHLFFFQVSLFLPYIQSHSEKQIKLDLYRTLPSNRHFKFGGEGVSRRQ